MEASTAVAQRPTFDLTQDPGEHWHKNALALAKATVLPSAANDAEVYYCLALAESLDLSPFANEIYFLPGKAQDGGSRKILPYVGREGLVKKANAVGGRLKGDVVHRKDDFTVIHHDDGKTTVHHSHGATGRGPIVGAWAMLFTADDPPAFFYADMKEYKSKSEKVHLMPWGNQTSAMILKCALIGAARQRINLAGVLIDAELDRVLEQGGQPAAPPHVEAEPFDFERLPEALRNGLREAVEEANELEPQSWPPAKCEMTFGGRSEDELGEILATLRDENAARRERGDGEEEIADAEVVTEDPRDHALALQARLTGLNERIESAKPGSEEHAALIEEAEGVERELADLREGGAEG